MPILELFRARPGALPIRLLSAALAMTVFVAPPGFAQSGGADGADRPDFSGLYFPAGFARRTPNPPPYTAAAQALAEQYEAQFRTQDDPGRYCIWPGMPRAPWGAPFSVEVFQRDQDLTIYWEGYGMYRKVYMADHNPPEALLPSRMGHSIAHWEGDTLVIETTDLRPYPYMNRFATSSSAVVVERMRQEKREVDGQTKTFLIDDIVVTDPKLYTEPVLIHAEAELREDLQLLEYTCTDTLWENYLLENGLTLPDVDALPDPQ
jgi:hypothetical protein